LFHGESTLRQTKRRGGKEKLAGRPAAPKGRKQREIPGAFLFVVKKGEGAISGSQSEQPSKKIGSNSVLLLEGSGSRPIPQNYWGCLKLSKKADQFRGSKDGPWGWKYSPS